MAVKQMAYIGKGSDKFKCCILKQSFAEMLMNSTEQGIQSITGSLDYLEEYFLTEVGDDIAQYYSMFPENPPGGVDSIQKDLCTLDNGDKLAFRLRSYNIGSGVRLIRGLHSYMYYKSTNKYVELFKWEPQSVEWAITNVGKLYGRCYIGLAYDDVTKKAKLYLVTHGDVYDYDEIPPKFTCWLHDFAYHTDPSTVYELFVDSSITQVLDPWGNSGFAGIGGGDIELDLSSDIIGLPDVPQSVVSTGFIQLYTPTFKQVNELSDYMWGDGFLNNVLKLWNDPMDIIINLAQFRFPIPSIGSQFVTAGNVVTSVVMDYPANQYITIDCGTLEITPFYNAYIDYEPYTTCEIYLPYIGFQTLSMDEIMGKILQVTYRVDLVTGICCAYILCNGTVMYSYVGTCSANIPVSGQNFQAMTQSIINIACSGAASAVKGKGNPGASMMASGAQTIMSLKAGVSRSGNVSSNAGFMGPQKPYLVFTVPHICLPKDQNKYIGYPAYVTFNLSELMGFTVIDEIIIKNCSCTDEEKSEIETLLKGGVFL